VNDRIDAKKISRTDETLNPTYSLTSRPPEVCECEKKEFILVLVHVNS